MDECYKCGISKDKATLYEGVYKTGIVMVCRKCFFLLKLPLIDTKKVDWAAIDNKGTVRDRLENMSGVKDVKTAAPREEFGLRTDNAELKQIVEQNFQREKIVSKEETTGLIENFHWVIMRKRRSMKYTIGEFSLKLREPEIILESLEKGILPRDYEALIKKVEVLLGLRLFVHENQFVKQSDIISESKLPTGITVSDVIEKTPIKDFFFKKKDPRSEEEILREKIEEDLSSKRLEDDFIPEELNLATINAIVGAEIIPEKIPFEPRYEDTNPTPVELNVESRESRVESKDEYYKASETKREEPSSWNQSPQKTEAAAVMDEIKDKILDEKVYSREVESGGESRIPENVRLAMLELETQNDIKPETTKKEIDDEDVSRLAWGK